MINDRKIDFPHIPSRGREKRRVHGAQEGKGGQCHPSPGPFRSKETAISSMKVSSRGSAEAK